MAALLAARPAVPLSARWAARRAAQQSVRQSAQPAVACVRCNSEHPATASSYRRCRTIPVPVLVPAQQGARQKARPVARRVTRLGRPAVPGRRLSTLEASTNSPREMAVPSQGGCPDLREPLLARPLPARRVVQRMVRPASRAVRTFGPAGHHAAFDPSAPFLPVGRTDYLSAA